MTLASCRFRQRMASLGLFPSSILAAIVVVPGAWVHALHVGHQVQCGVEFPVARTRQPVSDGISAGYLDRAVPV